MSPNRDRVRLIVEFDLDPLPGANHTDEDARKWLLVTLTRSIPHYRPQVMIDDRPDPMDFIKSIETFSNGKVKITWASNAFTWSTAPESANNPNVPSLRIY